MYNTYKSIMLLFKINLWRAETEPYDTLLLIIGFKIILIVMN